MQKVLVSSGHQQSLSSGRGLRQGDHLSPYLFTLVMKVLSGILRRCSNHSDFRFYWRCKATRLSHIFFADDVFLFCEGHLPSILLLKEGLQQFSSWSGLIPNKRKSKVFLSGGSSLLQEHILQDLGFQEGSLPVRYWVCQSSRQDWGRRIARLSLGASPPGLNPGLIGSFLLLDVFN